MARFPKDCIIIPDYNIFIKERNVPVSKRNHQVTPLLFTVPPTLHSTTWRKSSYHSKTSPVRHLRTLQAGPSLVSLVRPITRYMSSSSNNSGWINLTRVPGRNPELILHEKRHTGSSSPAGVPPPRAQPRHRQDSPMNLTSLPGWDHPCNTTYRGQDSTPDLPGDGCSGPRPHQKPQQSQMNTCRSSGSHPGRSGRSTWSYSITLSPGFSPARHHYRKAIRPRPEPGPG